MFTLTKIILIIGILLMLCFGIWHYHTYCDLEITYWATLIPAIAVCVCVVVVQFVIASNNTSDDKWTKQIVEQVETVAQDETHTIYLPEEQNFYIVEKVDNTYYFYNDKNLDFKDSQVVLENASVKFEKSDDTYLKVKTIDKKWKETYIFNKKPWYFSKKDYKRIDKSRKYSSNGNIRDKECGSETTVVTFFVPENTRIKYKDKNDVTIYKNVLDMNTPPNT